jgi:antitoxin (DNA-binding transcriptional repressor) of toxin-antitoxin stability system
MRTFNLQEAKKRFSELLDRAERGERIGPTKEEKVVAILGPASREKAELKSVFRRLEKIRKRAKKIPGMTAKSLIEEGRM